MSKVDLAVPALLSAVLTGLLFGLTGDVGINLADEGFLWYGVQRVTAGEVPLRDFQAYDPGRYYWGAAWSPLFGTGLLGVRRATAVFQALGLFSGLCVLRRLAPAEGKAGVSVLAGLGAVLLVWMFPRHKLYESAVSLMAVLFALRLLERPTVRRHLSAGVFVGLAAFLGRNHGLYCALGFLAVIAIAHRSEPEGQLRARLGAWAGGVVLGFSPMLAMLVCVPSMWSAFVESLLLQVSRGSNLPTPIPWPWTLDYGSPFADLAPDLIVGFGYLGMVVVYPLGILWALLGRRGWRARPIPGAVLVASVCIGLPYAHHAVIRAGAAHLAQSIQPLLLAACALPAALSPQSWRIARRAAESALWILLLLGSIVAGWCLHPELQHFGAQREPALVEHSVAGDRLELRPDDAGLLGQLERIFAERVPPGEPVFIAPFFVTLYPALDRVSPVWDLYMLWEASEAHQQEMVRALEARTVSWVLLSSATVEGQETTFAVTHSLVLRYLQQRFVPVQEPSMPAGFALLRRR